MDLTWRKASRSTDNGGHCVEAAVTWHKASRSTNNGGACVEVAGLSRVVLVRDSKDPDGPKLVFGRAAWRDFTASLRPPR